MQQPEGSAKRTPILVIDPDPDARLEIRRILEPEGLEVREAAAADACASLDEHLRLVLVASSLGETEVVSLCEGLQASSRRSHFAISVMADARTLASPASLEAFERAGASDFLARPCEAAFLRHRVRCLVRSARHLRDLQSHRARLDEAQQLAGVGIWELDLEDGRLSCSDAARRILGLGPAATEADLRQAVHAEDRERFEAAWRATLTRGAPLAVRHRVGSGEADERRVETRGGLVLGDEGEPALLRGASVLENASFGHWSAGGASQSQGVGGPTADETSRLALEARLRGAIERNDLALYYQPKAHADTRRITSLEALIRWTDAELGAVAPSDFIPVAESCELIVPIGLWVLRTACRQVVDWGERGVAVGRVAVNVSPRQFRAPGFVDSVLAMIEETGVDPKSLELEITEGCLLEADHASATLEALRSRGCGIAIDDFGTGYSSLQYLRRLPIDALKIDRAFIRDLEGDAEARSLVASIISLAWSLGLRVVAEGVETEAQWEFLRDHGCDEIQGFALSCALPPQECEALIRSRSDASASEG